MPRPESQEKLGRSIAGRYRITRWLGEGGHGWVYEALDEATDTRVALKIVKPEHASEMSHDRLMDEAKASQSVEHHGVARIMSVGEDGGDAYVVMELVDGPTLRAYRTHGDVFSTARIAEVFMPLTEAVAAVHRAGLVHRDLKPSNVGLVLGEDGVPTPKLLDFGLAKAVDGDAHTTTSGRILGTPHYMSPEQALGEPTNDPRVDVWALGVMIYECLEGQRPYGGGSATAVLMNILRLEPRALSRHNAQSALGAVVMRALSREIDARYADAGALHEALSKAIDADRGGKVVRAPRSRRRVFALAALLTVLIAGGAVAAFHTRTESPAAPRQAERPASALPAAPQAPARAADVDPPPSEVPAVHAPVTTISAPPRRSLAPRPVVREAPLAPAPELPPAESATVAAPAAPPASGPPEPVLLRRF